MMQQIYAFIQYWYYLSRVLYTNWILNEKAYSPGKVLFVALNVTRFDMLLHSSN